MVFNVMSNRSYAFADLLDKFNGRDWPYVPAVSTVTGTKMPAG